MTGKRKASASIPGFECMIIVRTLLPYAKYTSMAKESDSWKVLIPRKHIVIQWQV